jgi:hypothetical protein
MNSTYEITELKQKIENGELYKGIRRVLEPS